VTSPLICTGRSAALLARATTIRPTGSSTVPHSTITGQPWQIPPESPAAAIATSVTPMATRTVPCRGRYACIASTVVSPPATAATAAGSNNGRHAYGVCAPRILIGRDTSTQPTNHNAAAITSPSSRCRSAAPGLSAAPGNTSVPASSVSVPSAIAAATAEPSACRCSWATPGAIISALSSPARAAPVASAPPAASVRCARRAAPVCFRPEFPSNATAGTATNKLASPASSTPDGECTKTLCRISRRLGRVLIPSCGHR
jgi:hypothetical protein